MFRKKLREIHNKLLTGKKTVSVAESCTGGLVSSLLTSESGSSGYFLLGVVAYSNKSKEKILGIPAKIIKKYGAVSCHVAKLMAENIRKKAGSDFGVSITGIAGPGGALKNKPVGTVFIGLSKKNKNICKEFLFCGNRQNIRNKSAREALHLLCAHL
ncbi:MAG: nicotinamide-nucleotide amidohydrolase family protein [Candidatus Omnitrophota bacterium]